MQLLQLKLTICLSVPDIILVSLYFGIGLFLIELSQAYFWGLS